MSFYDFIEYRAIIKYIHLIFKKINYKYKKYKTTFFLHPCKSSIQILTFSSSSITTPNSFYFPFLFPSFFFFSFSFSF